MRSWFARSLAAMAAAAVLVGTAVPAFADPAAHFSDFQPAAWWATSVQLAADLGVLQGFPNGTVQPNAPVTRAQFATMLARAAGYGAPKTVSAAGFSDVSTSDWFAPGVDALTAAGIIKVADYPTDAFAPNANITRGAMATWIGRVLKQRGVPLADLGTLAPMTVLPEGALQAAAPKPGENPVYANIGFASTPLPAKVSAQTFTDVTAATPHEADIMEAARYGVIDGFPGGTFQPNADATRAQAAKVIDILVNELAGSSTPTVATLEAAATRYLDTISKVEQATPTSGTVTAQDVFSRFLGDGIQNYAAQWAVIGPGEPVAGIVSAKKNKSLVIYSDFKVQGCKPIFAGAQVAEADCVVGVRAYTAKGPVLPSASNYGWLVYFIHARQGWLVSQTTSYFDVPPWFQSSPSN